MSSRTNRILIAIGGKEDRSGENGIIKEIARHIGSGKLVVMTVASPQSEEVIKEYNRVFRQAGIRRIAHLPLDTRNEGKDKESLKVLEDAKGIFFTGGDQLRITSQIGDSPVFEQIKRLYRQGAIVAGTSSGAAALCETMLVSGSSEETHKLGGVLRMAPGLGLIGGVIIDMHFAERGRMGRLLGAVAQNPRVLGLGIDENTAIVIRNEERFSVLGDGAVYIVDGESITESNVAEENQEQTLAVLDLRLHLLSAGYEFDLKLRRPLKAGSGEDVPPPKASGRSA